MNASKPRLLFVCIHNSARSQMAEAFAKKYAGDAYDVLSAGLERGTLNPVVVEVMREAGFDISAHTSKSLDDIDWRNQSFDVVVTVCDETSAERCPVVPSSGNRLHWSFADPASFHGSHETILAKTRAVRDEIERAVQRWASQLDPAK